MSKLTKKCVSATRKIFRKKKKKTNLPIVIPTPKTRNRLPSRPKYKKSAIVYLDTVNSVGTNWVTYKKIGKSILL